MIRRIRFSRWGLAENPIGAIIRYRTREGYALREVTETYRREVPPAIMLKVRSFNREVEEDIAASAAELILPDPEDFTMLEE